MFHEVVFKLLLFLKKYFVQEGFWHSLTTKVLVPNSLRGGSLKAYWRGSRAVEQNVY